MATLPKFCPVAPDSTHNDLPRLTKIFPKLEPNKHTKCSRPNKEKIRINVTNKLSCL